MAVNDVTHKVTVNLEVPESLSFTIGTKNDDSTVVDLKSSTSAATGLFSASSIDLYVDTTVKGGYALSMVGSTAEASNVAVLRNASGTATDNKNEIPGTGIKSGQSTSAWGYQASNDNDSNTGDIYTAIPTSSSAIRTTTNAAAEHTYVKFGAYVAPGQEAGTYSGQVTFTASAPAA